MILLIQGGIFLYLKIVKGYIINKLNNILYVMYTPMTYKINTLLTFIQTYIFIKIKYIVSY